MAMSNMTPADVKAECDRLETSPQGNYKGGDAGGANSINPTNKEKGPFPTGTFDKAAAGVPGYGKKNTGRARKE